MFIFSTEMKVLYDVVKFMNTSLSPTLSFQIKKTVLDNTLTISQPPSVILLYCVIYTYL
jgi:hypothetical protein